MKIELLYKCGKIKQKWLLKDINNGYLKTELRGYKMKTDLLEKAAILQRDKETYAIAPPFFMHGIIYM